MIRRISVVASGRLPKRRLIKICGKLFAAFSKHPRIKKCRPKKPSRDFVDLSLVFINQARMKALNSRYLQKNYPTDILSFSPEAAGEGLGELVVCAPVLRKQAKEQGHSFNKELDYMVIHGFLHLLGYDHEKSRREELKMFKLQDRLFKKLSED